MMLADLTFEQWRSLDLDAARRFAGEAAARADARVLTVETVEHLGAPLHRVRIVREGREFALVPGGRVRLGFDPGAWSPTPAQEADFAESLVEGYGFGAQDLSAHLVAQLSPPRTVEVPTVWMAVEAEPAPEPADGIASSLAARGLRLPGADEWEHACGAGARTLFRWGDECPLDEAPYGAGGIRNEPNAFGLRIAHDSYSAELSDDRGAVHGGDGGTAVCGGYGNLLGWLPLATAHRNADMAEFVYGPDGEYAWESFSVRPVLTLP
ncbi:hypothetical protein [Streptomyces sp. SPB4]|uniref:hypothetical protein n=1 Tax=Streptomyces sp. SPB4 TaxID=2940553 RepID=UPI002476B429|nr:hypothetical protein [Streptomyces sp. SPB4]MDH6543660.1 hypothetical protein [Streptomyces sp. SPB4]